MNNGETFKSDRWQACGICTRTIKPGQKVGLVWEEVACNECARSAKVDPLDPNYHDHDMEVDIRNAREY